MSSSSPFFFGMFKGAPHILFQGRERGIRGLWMSDDIDFMCPVVFWPQTKNMSQPPFDAIAHHRISHLLRNGQTDSFVAGLNSTENDSARRAAAPTPKPLQAHIVLSLA